jgi:membrane-bound serine protease (ClpP class)
MNWLWSILLLILGLGLALMEVFFPSAGILGFLAACSIVAAIVLGFLEGPVVGLLIVGVAGLGLPALVILGFRIWPRTAIGRRVLLDVPDSKDVLPEDPQRQLLRSLVGKVGRAKCKMLPGGVVVIDGQNVEAVSESVAIEQGQPVLVIDVRAGRAVVRPIEPESLSANAENPLERPIDTVIPDPFADQKKPET